MSADVFTLWVGDLEPDLAYEFGFSLADAVSVSFSAMDSAGDLFIQQRPAIIANGNYTVDGEARALTAEDGIVFYRWTSGDTSQARKAKGLFRILWPDNRPQTHPSEGYVYLNIIQGF